MAPKPPNTQTPRRLADSASRRSGSGDRVCREIGCPRRGEVRCPRCPEITHPIPGPRVPTPAICQTASNRIARGDRAREVNRENRDFLEYKRIAAVPNGSAGACTLFANGIFTTEPVSICATPRSGCLDGRDRRPGREWEQRRGERHARRPSRRHIA